jgi:hypothetical protein
MGRLLWMVAFFVSFVIYAIVKSVATGATAAYEAVFDPNAKDQRIQELVGYCMLRVSHAMHEHHASEPGELKMAILQLTPVVQSLILEAGYKVNASIAERIVCQAIVVGRHATEEEIISALA